MATLLWDLGRLAQRCQASQRFVDICFDALSSNPPVNSACFFPASILFRRNHQRQRRTTGKIPEATFLKTSANPRESDDLLSSSPLLENGSRRVSDMHNMSTSSEKHTPATNPDKVEIPHCFYMWFVFTADLSEPQGHRFEGYLFTRTSRSRYVARERFGTNLASLGRWWLERGWEIPPARAAGWWCF